MAAGRLRIGRGQRAVAAGAALLGVLAGLLPQALAVEEQFGLAGLFRLRGELPTPDGVAVVAISRATADAFELPVNLREWPRSLHAELIGALEGAGASAIVFDIAFAEARESVEDARLAAAIAASGRVILLEQIRASRVEIPGLAESGRQLQQLPALPQFAVPALGTGPFTLPTVPIRTSQFWAFGAGNSAAPMLPALAVQAALLDTYEPFIAVLTEAAGHELDLPVDATAVTRDQSLERVMQEIRRVFATDPGLEDRLLRLLPSIGEARESTRNLRVLTAMYAGSASRFLNFYGPSGTILTRQFHEIVRPDGGSPALDGFDGRVVFVGFAESEQSEQRDDFISVFSQQSGLSLSGVEIGATAFANLLNDSAVKPLGRVSQSILLAVWAILLVALVARLPLAIACLCALVLGGTYVLVAARLFGEASIWLPLVIPVGIQLPGILLADMLIRYRRISLQRERLQRALGPYAAPAVIDRLARDTANVRHVGRLVHGTCLVTDVAGYTSLAETLAPAVLADLMHEYFELLGEVITAGGGTVGDVSGDSMVGLWVAAGPTAATSRAALRAAIALNAKLTAFNARAGRVALRTRIGIEAGAVALSLQQPSSAVPYRPVGDIVNTAARVQGLNRWLGTDILLTGAVREATRSLPARYVGRFLLLGKRESLEVWDVEPARSGESFDDPNALTRFAHALMDFQRGKLGAARAEFQSLTDAYPSDGPSRFYLAQCEKFIAAGLSPGWNGTIVMATK